MNRYFREDIKKATGLSKNVHPHQLSGKCKVKQPRDINSSQWEYSIWKSPETINATGRKEV